MSESDSSNHSVEGNTREHKRDHTDRPMSPHLQVYKPQITSILSICHRISGVALTIGNLFLVAWLYGLAFSPDTFYGVNGFLTSWLGKIFLMGWAAAFFYHLFAGIRHLAWDFGYGFELGMVYKSGYAVLIATAVFTFITWLIILF